MGMQNEGIQQFKFGNGMPQQLPGLTLLPPPPPGMHAMPQYPQAAMGVPMAGLPGLPPPPGLSGLPLNGLPALPPGMRPPNFNGVGRGPPPVQRDDTLVNQSQLPSALPFRPKPPPPPEPSVTQTKTVMGADKQRENITLIPGASNNAQPKVSVPELIPHITMMPDNPFFPVVERDVTGILKVGRVSSSNEPSPESDFIGFKSKVVRDQSNLYKRI